MLWARAWWIWSSTRVKSNLPSCGSTSSQEAVPITVLRFMASSFFQMGFMYSMLEALELCNSPASMRNGLPSTIICFTAPFCLMAGIGAADPAATAGGCGGVCEIARAQAKKKSRR